MEQDKKQDDHFHILYTTFALIGVFVLLWGLIFIFNQEEVNILEEINNDT